MAKRKTQAILRTHTYSKLKQSEKYFHSKLMLYVPWRSEEDLKHGFLTFEEAFMDQANILISNCELYEKKGVSIEEAMAMAMACDLAMFMTIAMARAMARSTAMAISSPSIEKGETPSP